MLLEVMPLLVTSLVPAAGSLLLLLVALLNSLNLLLLCVGNADHTPTAVGARDELAILIMATSTKL